jgi:hypothetical protein
MKLKTLINRMPFYYKSGISIYIKSPPGRGKTQTLESASTILSQKFSKNMGHVVINGPLLTPQDAVGYLIPKHTDNGAESFYTDPFWFKTKEGKRLSDFDGGVIIVDEADKMDTDVKKVIGEAALSGRLGPHSLAGGWVVWMAGNRSGDRSGSTKELDHLINRRMELDIEDDIEGFVEWCQTHGVMPVTQAFAQQNPTVVFSATDPVKQGPWCTPRSLVRMDGFIQLVREANNGELPEDPDTIEEGSGMIGAGAAMQYFGYVKLERAMPKFERIIAEPDKVKVPEKPDALMLIAFNLASRVDEKTIGPVVKYMERMPKEFAVTFMKAAVNRKSSIVATPAVQKWALENSSLMASIAKP